MDAPFVFMDIQIFIYVVLAAWRLASMLADEHGPYLVLERLRFILGVYYSTRDGIVVKTHKQFSALSEQDQAGCVRITSNVVSEAITCVWCSSVWIAALLVLLILWFGQPVVWVCLPLSVSAGAIIVNRIVNG